MVLELFPSPSIVIWGGSFSAMGLSYTVRCHQFAWPGPLVTSSISTSAHDHQKGLQMLPDGPQGTDWPLLRALA